MAYGPATRKRVKARLALVGMSKSGKSLLALALARGIVGPEGRIAAIDTENGALSLYANRFPGDAQPSGFDVQDLTNATPKAYINCIAEAAKAKYDALVIDSTSQEWGAILEMVDGNADKFFGGWKAATPAHNEFIRAIVSAPMHVIVTIRQKDEYRTEERDGKNVPVKVGLEPVQRKQFEYEFNALMTIDLEHNIRVTHSAIEFMPNGSFIPAPTPTQSLELGQDIKRWLDAGTEDWTAPVYRKIFYVNDKEVVSAGIEKETYKKVMNLGLALNKVVKPKGGAKQFALDHTGKGAIQDLTEEEGVALIVAMQEALDASGTKE